MKLGQRILLLILLGSSPTCGIAAQRTLTYAEARESVRAALPPTTARYPRLSFEDVSPDPYFPGYFEFQVLWDSPPQTSPNLGFFKVDQKTGDVWSGVV